MCTSAARHAWLEAARIECEAILIEAGHPAPSQVRISIGFAYGKRKALGQCVAAVASSDDHAEIVISPVVKDGVNIMGTLIHELAHAITPGAGHGAPFKRICDAVGLVGKATCNEPGPALKARLERWIETHGAYPAGALSLGDRKKQTTRMIKCECAECGYVARTSAKWIDAAGPPHCPDHGAMTAS